MRDSSYRRKIEAKFRGLLEAAPDAMIVADRDGRIPIAPPRLAMVYVEDPERAAAVLNLRAADTGANVS